MQKPHTSGYFLIGHTIHTKEKKSVIGKLPIKIQFRKIVSPFLYLVLFCIQSFYCSQLQLFFSSTKHRQVICDLVWQLNSEFFSNELAV